jgi:hypothetical protein
MARYLVVAHETVSSPLLLDAVRGVRKQDAEAEFVLLVPATPVRHLLFRKGDGATPRPPPASAASGPGRCSRSGACR